MKKRGGGPDDVEIGRRIRALRLQRGLSQTDLGKLLDLTFQQIQKYEKGVNRVSAVRLRRIAELLEVPVTFFYVRSGEDSLVDQPDLATAGLEFLNTAGAVRLVRAYSQIRDSKVRGALVGLAERIVQRMDEKAA